METAHLVDQVASIASRLHDLEQSAGARNELLIRIDERTKAMATLLETMNGNYVKKEELNKMVTKEVFDPIRKLVYGVVGLILVGFFTALTVFVYKK